MIDKSGRSTLSEQEQVAFPKRENGLLQFWSCRQMATRMFKRRSDKLKEPALL
jgi:hypothetical protein